MTSDNRPRGVRNNNPGNVDRTKDVWQGEDRSASAMAQERRFCVFITPEMGFRALAKTLLTYQRKHGLRTVREIISRWAPSVENNTASYVRAVADEVGVAGNEIITLTKQVTLFRLARAIARHENGGLFWSDAVINAGVEEALK